MSKTRVLSGRISGGASPQGADGAFSHMVSLLIRTQVLWDQGPTFITSTLITS